MTCMMQPFCFKHSCLLQELHRIVTEALRLGRAQG